MRIIKRLIFIFCLLNFLYPSLIYAQATQCKPLPFAAYSNRNAKIDIRDPGKYCLGFDIHARIDFADHPSEGRLIHIWTSNVEVDLKGHTIGRGRFFVQRGGIGIELDGNSTNVKIKNGMLENFEIGIYRTGYKDNKKPIFLSPINKDKSYFFENDHIIFQNIVFKNCQRDFIIQGWVDDVDH